MLAESGLHIRRPIDLPIPGACSSTFSGGTVALGGACDDDAECATGRCSGCPGVCRGAAPTGSECGQDQPCTDTDGCVRQNGHYACTRLTQLAIGAASPSGRSCDLFGPGCTSCTASGSVDDPVTGLCTANLPLGATCVEARECADGLTCRTGGHCEVPLPPGATCASDECAVGACTYTGMFDADGKPLATCWSNPNTTPCGSAVCDSKRTCVHGSCVKHKQVGEQCVWAQDDCDLSVCGPDGTCTYQPCAMASCGVAVCNADGTCPVKRVGDACSVNDDCDFVPGGTLMPVCDKGRCRADNVACYFPAGTP